MHSTFNFTLIILNLYVCLRKIVGLYLVHISRHVRHLCRNISVDISRHEVARGHCDRRPRHCCVFHSDELPSADALSALQHHLSGTVSLSLFRTVTSSRYLNLDLKHICSPPFMLLNCPVRQRLWSHGNMALYKFCIIIIIIIKTPRNVCHCDSA